MSDIVPVQKKSLSQMTLSELIQNLRARYTPRPQQAQVSQVSIIDMLREKLASMIAPKPLPKSTEVSEVRLPAMNNPVFFKKLGTGVSSASASEGSLNAKIYAITRRGMTEEQAGHQVIFHHSIAGRDLRAGEVIFTKTVGS